MSEEFVVGGDAVPLTTWVARLLTSFSGICFLMG